jgi:cytochrome c-type biogenesis protein CcmH/NrfG
MKSSSCRIKKPTFYIAHLLLRTIINNNPTQPAMHLNSFSNRDSFSNRCAKQVERRSCLALLGGLASALTSLAGGDTGDPSERVLSQVRQSIVVVESVDARGKRIAEGSAVAIREGEAVTTCTLIRGGASIHIREAGKTFKAVVRHKRQDLDLCQLEVADLRAPPVEPSTKKPSVGERALAVGMSSKQELRPIIHSTEISALLPYEGSWYMRISTVPSPGFEGGGVFNDSGQLIGILALRHVEGQNLAFALPVDWIRELEKKATPASAKKENGLEWLNRSFALEKKGDWHGLLKLSQQQVGRDRDSAAAWFEVGTASLHLKQYRQAVHAFREAIRNQARYGEAWHGLGTAYMHLKEYDHAVHALRDAVRLQPENAEAWYELGKAYHETEQYPYAIDAYNQSLRFHAENPAVWYSLGKTYDELDLYGEAMDAYRETVRIEPKNVDALYSLGVDYALAGERAEMRKIYGALRGLDPEKAELYFKTYILP